MTIFRSDAFRNARADSDVAQIGVSAQFQVRSGANSGVANQGTLGAQLTCDATAFGVNVAGVTTVNPITPDSSADATITAGHYQLNTQAGVFIESGNLVDDGIIINNASIALGQEVQFNAPWTRVQSDDDGV